MIFVVGFGGEVDSCKYFDYFYFNVLLSMHLGLPQMGKG